MNNQHLRGKGFGWLVVLVTLTIMLTGPAGLVQASDVYQGTPPGASGAVQPLVDLVTSVAKLFIQFFVFSSVAVFAVSVARGFWSAQIANLVGSPMGVSQAWLNIIAAVFIFILAVMSTTFVSIVFDAVKGYVDTSIPIPQF